MANKTILQFKKFRRTCKICKESIELLAQNCQSPANELTGYTKLKNELEGYLKLFEYKNKKMVFWEN